MSGVTIGAKSLVDSHDAVALAGGAEASRDLPVPGRDLAGVHFAMDFLPQQNRRVSGEPVGTNEPILANGKHVVVIGGGDTGSDCIGTSIRQGALKVTQLEIMPMPPKAEDKLLTWPNWPLKLRTSSSHEEGAERDFAVNDGRLRGRERRGHRPQMRARRREVQADRGDANSRSKADLVLLAMGFVSPVKEGLLSSSASRSTSAAMSPPTSPATPPRAPRSMPAATCGAASRWWSGRSAKAANARRRSTRR